MKRILPALLAVLLVFVFCLKTSAEDITEEQENCIGIETLNLDVGENFGEQEVQEVSVQNENKSLKEVLHDVYELEIDKYDRPSYLFEEPLTHYYSEKSPIKSTHIWGAFNAYPNLQFSDDGRLLGRYDTNALNVGIDGTFKNDVADFRIMMGFPPHSERNFAQTLFSDVYIGTNKVPHHRFLIGHIRPPVGKEGGNSAYTLPFLNRAQISRNFGTARRVGARAIGDYNLVDYDIGVYSSDVYFQEFFPGAEFVGWVNFKPLGKTDGRYGSLKIGGGLDAGHRDNNFCVTGAYIGYEYKRFMLNFEWANANGYNGPVGYSVNKHATGFYSTVGYMLTKKLQLLARYDQFNPDKSISNNNRREYSAGINYFIKGQAMRLILNYVFCQNDNAKDSHRILLGLQILI